MEIDAVLGGRTGSPVPLDVVRVLIGAAACLLFYPNVLCNVVRNRIQP